MPRKQIQNLPYSGFYNGVNTTATNVSNTANKQWRSVWFKTTTFNRAFMALANDAGVNLRMFVNLGFASAYTSAETNSGIFVADGRWHHMVMYHEIVGASGGVIKLWVDGVLRATGSSASRNNAAYPMVVGNDGGGTYFLGNIGWIAEGSGAPTDLEVWNMYYRNVYPSHTTGMYKFGEGTGSTSAADVGSNNLTLANFAWSQAVPPQMANRLMVRNQPGLGFQTGESISSGSNTGITGSAAFTMGGWCKFGDPTGTFQMYTNFGASAAAQSWHLGCSDTNMLTAGLFSNQRVTSIPIPRNRWIHYICSWDGTTLRIYVNGKLVDASTSGSAGAYSPNIAAGVFKIARSMSGVAYNFSGLFSETFLANAALTVNQINQIFTKSVYPSSATIVYRFQERGGTTVADSSGNANNGTLTSEALWARNCPSNPRISPRDMRASLGDFTAASLTRVDCGNAAALQITTGTVLAWYRSRGPRGSASAVYSTILSKDTNYAMYEYLGQLIAYDWNMTANRVSGYYTPDNNWHLAAYVFESGVASGSWLTMDAGPIRGRFIYTMTANGVNVNIGNQGSGSNAMRGFVGEVVICNTKLTQAQIADYYYRGKLPASAVSRWRMNEGTGNTASDSVGSSNGTLSGATLPVWYPETALANRL